MRGGSLHMGMVEERGSSNGKGLVRGVAVVGIMARKTWLRQSGQKDGRTWILCAWIVVSD